MIFSWTCTNLRFIERENNGWSKSELMISVFKTIPCCLPVSNVLTPSSEYSSSYFYFLFNWQQFNKKKKLGKAQSIM